MDIRHIIKKYENGEVLSDFELLHLKMHYEELDTLTRKDPNLKAVSFYSTQRLIQVTDMYNARKGK